MLRLLCILLGLLLLSALSSCGARTFAEYELGHLSVTVSAVGDSGLQESDLSVDVRPVGRDGEYALELSSLTLDPRSTALLELRFPENFHVVDSSVPAAKDAQLALLVTDKPGLVAFGALMPEGKSLPQGELLSLRLAPGTPARRAAAPPVIGGVVSDLAVTHLDSETIQLDWSYVNVGDYNQDGLVNVADLTQIGIFFQQSGPWDYSDVHSVVDGTGDGLISVADLTPIGLNYLRKTSGYSVSASETDVVVLAALQTVDELTLSEASGGISTRKRLSIQLPLADFPFDYACVRPFELVGETQQFGPPSNTVLLLSETDTTPPVWTGSTGITSAVPGSGQVTVSWGEATDAQSPPVSYTVFYSAGPEVEFPSANTVVVPAPELQTTITGLDNGQLYSFAVRASDSAFLPNQELNEVMLSATPAPGKAFGVPPAGTQTADAQSGLTPQLVIVPSTTASADAGAPVIFTLRTEVSPAGNHLFCTRFSEGAWTSSQILADSSYSGLQAFAFVDGSQVLTFHVFTYDLTSGKVLHLQFDDLLAQVGSEDVSLNPTLAQVLGQLSVDFDAAGDSFGVLASYNDTSGGVLRFSEKVGAGAYATFADVYSGDPVVSASFRYDPAGGQPWLAFIHGTINTTDTIDFSMTGETGRFDGAAWTLTALDYTEDPAQIELSFKADNTPLLAFSAVRPITVGPASLDVLFDGVVADYNGAAWNYNLAYQAGFNIEFGIPDSMVNLTLAPALSWAGTEELLVSELDGSILVSTLTQEVTGGSLSVQPLYREGDLGNYSQDSSYFTGDPGLGFDWAQAPAGPAAAYTAASSLSAEDILAGNLSASGALLYWSGS